MIYDSSLTLREARDKYFAIHGFSEAAYFERFSKIQAGPLYYYILNTKGRQEAIHCHDLHHVLTEYDTTLTGEAEIGAWEIASGVPLKYVYGIFLDGMGAVFGLLHHPRRVIRAFRRGLRSRNFYQEFARNPAIYDDLLKLTVGEDRQRLLG
jgi:hypothetical protein